MTNSFIKSITQLKQWKELLPTKVSVMLTLMTLMTKKMTQK